MMGIGKIINFMVMESLYIWTNPISLRVSGKKGFFRKEIGKLQSIKDNGTEEEKGKEFTLVKMVQNILDPGKMIK